jgi:CHAT domain-containing protein/Tfp pilus assembly protein PilF
MGYRNIKLSELNLALNQLKQSAEIYENIGLEHEVAKAVHEVGLVYYYKGQYDKAQIFYQQSLALKEKLKDTVGIALSLNDIGRLYFVQGKSFQALETHTRSLAIKEKDRDKPGIASSLNNIGMVYDQLGDFMMALDYYKQSLKIIEELDNQRGIAIVSNNIGIIQHYLENYEEAIQSYEQSLKIKEVLNDKDGIATTWSNLGITYEKLEDYEKAFHYYQKSLALRTEIEDSHGMSYSLNNLGTLFIHSNEPEKVIENSLRALQISQEIGFPEGIKSACLNLIIAYRQKAQNDEALKYLDLLKNTVNKGLNTNYFSLTAEEKENYFATMESDFGRYYDFAAQNYEPYPQLADSCYNIILRNKSLALKSSTAMRKSILESGDSALIQQFEQWLDLRMNITMLYEDGEETKTLEQNANLLERELIKQSKDFSNLEQIKQLKWTQVQNVLAENEAAIEFVHYNIYEKFEDVVDVQYAALLIRSNQKHPVFIPLCKASELEAILGQTQSNQVAYVNEIYGTQRKSNSQLFEKIWKPLESTLKGIEKVYFSPAGLLHKIAFSAIRTTEHQYLSDLFELNQVNSTAQLIFSDRSKISNTDVSLVMGGIDYSSSKQQNAVWEFLPGSLSEAKNIKQKLHANNLAVQLFTAKDATEENFKQKAADAHVLHLATHGFFFPDPEQVLADLKKKTPAKKPDKLMVFRGSPNYANLSFLKNQNPLMRSGLVLAGANNVWDRSAMAEGEDGILTAAEISNLDLRNAKLVVLSACETGLGDIKGSEGVYGLQRAFKMAGAQSLIMSLWQVPDKETSEFMSLFYQKLLIEKDTRKAFTQTQKEMRNKYDPYFWAAFVLVE